MSKKARPLSQYSKGVARFDPSSCSSCSSCRCGLFLFGFLVNAMSRSCFLSPKRRICSATRHSGSASTKGGLALLLLFVIGGTVRSTYTTCETNPFQNETKDQVTSKIYQCYFPLPCGQAFQKGKRKEIRDTEKERPTETIALQVLRNAGKRARRADRRPSPEVFSAGPQGTCGPT